MLCRVFPLFFIAVSADRRDQTKYPFFLYYSILITFTVLLSITLLLFFLLTHRLQF